MSCYRWLPALALVAFLPSAAATAPTGPDILGDIRAMPTGTVIIISACLAATTA